MPAPYEVYAYFNVDTLTGVFNGVAAIMGSDDFAGLMKTVSMLMGLIVLFTAAVNLRGMEMNVLPFIVWMLITHTLLFAPRTDVIITDRTGGQPPNVVSNIPLGLAFFAGFTSQAGDWLARSFDAVFALPNDIQYSKSGLLFGHKLVRTVQSVTISDINLRTDLQNFFRNCTFYDLLPSGSNPPLINPDTFQNSPDIWSLMSNTSVARGTTYHDRGAGGVEVSATCANTYNILNGYLTQSIQTAMNYYGYQVNPTAASQAAAGAMFDSQVQGTYQYFLNASQSASDLIKQAALINAADDASMFTALQTGDAAAAQVAIAKAQATAMANSAGITQAKMAEETLPIVRNTVEVVIYAMFPFLILMCIIAADKAPLVLRGYFMSMVWVQLWAPGYAVMNFVITSRSAQYLKTIAQSGLTIASAQPLNAQAISDMATAGGMVWAVPTLAAVIAKGFDMGIMAGVAKGTAAESASSQVGSSAGAGNFSQGQVNMDVARSNMHTANKWDTAATNVHGSGTDTEVRADGNQVVTTESGRQSVKIMANDPGALGATLQHMESSQLSQRANSTITEGKAEQTQATQQTTAAVAEVASTARQKVNTQTFGTDVSKQDQAQFVQNRATEYLVTQEIAKQTGLDQKIVAAALVNMSGGLNASAALNLAQKAHGGDQKAHGGDQKAPESDSTHHAEAGVGANIGANVEANNQYRDETSRKFSEALKHVSQEKMGEIQQYHHALATNESFRNAVASSQTDMTGVNAQLSHAQSLAYSGTAKIERGKQLAQEAQAVASGQAGISLDVAKLPENSARLLYAYERMADVALAGRGADEQLEVFRTAFNMPGFKPPAVTGTPQMPGHFADGTAVPMSEAELRDAYTQDGRAVAGTVNPEAYYQGHKPKTDTSTVTPPQGFDVKDIRKQIGETRALLNHAYREGHITFDEREKYMNTLIGIREGDKTRDNPEGIMFTNRQGFQSAWEMAKVDAKIGTIYGASPLGEGFQKWAAGKAGFNPEDLMRPDPNKPK